MLEKEKKLIPFYFSNDEIPVFAQQINSPSLTRTRLKIVYRSLYTQKPRKFRESQSKGFLLSWISWHISIEQQRRIIPRCDHNDIDQNTDCT